MRSIRQYLQKSPNLHCDASYSNTMVVFALSLACLFAAGTASAAEAGIPAPQANFPLGHVFTFLFLMLGPFKIIAPFAKITSGADAGLIRKLAVLSILFSSVALLLAALLGERILSSYGIPVQVLALSAGIILFLVALQSVLQQFTPQNENAAGPAASIPTTKMAMSPLAFPTIVTPYGIAALVVFLALSQSLEARLAIGAVVLAIMVLNLIVMILSRHIMSILSVVLPILGAVLGIVQVALGLQIMNNSLRALGIL